MSNVPDNEKMFAKWMEQLDDYFQIKIGISVHDLPDQSFWDMFDSGYDIGEAYESIIENEDIDVTYLKEEYDYNG